MANNGKIVAGKKKILIVADAGVDTGFAMVTHNIIDQLYKQYELHVLAINYRGDPHPLQQKCSMYVPNAYQSGDYYGATRIEGLVERIKPDILFFINDAWCLSNYTPALSKIPDTIRKIAYIPVDATGLKPIYIKPLNNFDHIVAYTAFGERELRNGGLTKPVTVIPHGVNTKYFKRIEKKDARAMSHLADDLFIVLNVNRNATRKRIDLTFDAFATWCMLTNKPDNVRLYYHGAVNDEGWDLLQLAAQLGIENRIILTHPNLDPAHGIDIEYMHYIYNVADVQISTSMGEG